MVHMFLEMNEAPHKPCLNAAQSFSNLEGLNAVHNAGIHEVLQKLSSRFLFPTLELDKKLIGHSRILKFGM